MERRERVAVFIIRAEVPDDARERLHARVTWRTRVDEPATERVRYAAARRELHDLLDRWLDAVAPGS